MSAIIVIVNELGMVEKIDVDGVQGASCTNLTKSLEEALVSDPETVVRECKPDYFDSEDETVENNAYS